MSRLNKRKKNNTQSWLVTYSDLVTLLLTFFVLLFSFSSIDAVKWKAIVQSLTGNIGVLEEGKTLDEGEMVNQGQVDDQIAKEADEQDVKFNKLYEDIKKYMDTKDLDVTVSMSEQKNEILIRFKDNVLFDSAKAILKQDAKEILDNIADGIYKFQGDINLVRVEGHTDNLPINTKFFPSNWELSTARAVKVVRYFVENSSIRPDIFSPSGYGEYRPVASNKTVKGRAKNRRVDIVIVRTE
ncbi:MAG: OmpA family protein [Clostridia bacterium]|nr:OmpA family protein [Clostridia bacterium]